jgi:hypothetical protein
MQPPNQRTFKYPRSLEPTQVAYSSETTEQAYPNPYIGSPYGLPPPPPPIPPKRKSYKWLYILLLVVAAIMPVSIYIIIYPAAPVTVHTLIVTPTPYPTFNVDDPILSMTDVLGVQIWECRLSTDQGNYADDVITFDNQSPDAEVYECERAESTLPNISHAGYADFQGEWCEGVMKDGTKWSITSDQRDAIVTRECKVLASW